MWIRILLNGNREKQKIHHRSLRAPIRELLDSKGILGFVMTYHTSNLYLCMNVPSLSDSTMNSLKTISSLSKITEYLDSSCKYEVPDDYLAAIQQRISKTFQDYRLSASQEMVTQLAVIELDNASRGCKVALQILERKIPIEKDPCRFYESIKQECIPLNGCFIISKASHFCFNSLGFSNIEEFAIECGCSRDEYMSDVELTVSKTKADEAVRRLGSREEGIFGIIA